MTSHNTSSLINHHNPSNDHTRDHLDDDQEFSPAPTKQKNLSVMGHLEELRWVLIKCCIAFLVGCGLVACFFPHFAKLLLYPLNKAVGDGTPLLQGLVTTSPMGIFSVIIDICIFGGLALALPAMLYFLAQYITPGLRFQEKSLLMPASIAVMLLFIVGSLFSYFYIIPASLQVAISLNEVVGFQLIWSASTYYSLVVWMTLGIGFCFEFPLAVLVLVHLGVVSTDKLKKIRRHMIVAVLILSALITPTSDPLSLAMLSIPLYILYEGAIIVGARMEKKRLRKID